MKARTPLSERFWAMVDIAGPDDCWMWIGPVRVRYGAIGEGGGHGRTLRSNRVAWELANGQSIPDGMIVRHTCDVPLCCNPGHLLLGSYQENTADAVERGRHVHGTDHPRHHLSEQDVHDIRALLADHVPQRRIADQFGISQRLVFGIKAGTHWSHLPVAGARHLGAPIDGVPSKNQIAAMTAVAWTYPKGTK